MGQIDYDIADEDLDVNSHLGSFENKGKFLTQGFWE